MQPSGVDEPDGPGSAAWWLAREARQARRRPRAAGLTTERITEVALAVVDAEGLDALTVRRLADELHTGSASLYRHVASRDELLVLLVDHVLGEVVLPDDELDGRAKLEHLAGELRRVLMAHADLLPALTSAPLLGPHAVRGVEAGLTYALELGFGPIEAVPATLALIDYVLGTVYFDTSRAGRTTAAGRDEAVRLLGARDGVRPDSWPAAVAPTADEVYALGLAALLDGLALRLPDDPPTRERRSH